MIYYTDFEPSKYNWAYGWYKREKVCTDIFNLDIETTSVFIDNDGVIYEFDKKKPVEFWEGCRKVGFCYIWQFGINNTVVYGRRLEDFIIFVNEILEVINAKICCYIHNASFEFQFLRNFLSDDVKVFARKERRPIYFADGLVEFRCSYMLTRLSLEKWATSKNLPATKAIENNFDYTLVRTPYTKLTAKELDYAERDILVMYYGIKQYVEKYGNIWDIPLTQTGEVRRELYKTLFDNDRLHKDMQKLVIDNMQLYSIVLECFWGGITHASQQYSNIVISDMDSWDIKSSYPWVMVSELFPMTPFSNVKPDKCFFNNARYSYIIIVELYKIRSKYWNTYLSVSKCSKLRGEIDDNGRLLYADYCLLVCTNVDYENVKKSYKIEREEILDFYVSINRPLSKDIILFILKLFSDKTTLDGVEGQEDNYAVAKQFINAMFGNMVTRDITDEVVYNNKEWDTLPLDDILFNKKVAKKKRNLRKLNTAVQVGVWITAYARNNLWQCVLNGNDEAIVYMDTDSDKLVKSLYNRDFFDKYNKKVMQKQEEIAERLGINIDLFRPISPKGKQACLGVYEYEGHYAKFKTLGAKKYIYEDDNGKLHMTVSGVRKDAVSQINNIDDFIEGLTFDIDHANKLLLHYNDSQLEFGEIVINKGCYDEYVMDCNYGICAQPTTYTLGLTGLYKSNILDIITLKSDCLELDEILERLIKNAKKRKADKRRKKKKNT